MNETCVLLVILMMITILNSNIPLILNSWLGWAIIGLIAANITVNLVVIVYATIMEIKNKYLQ